MFYLNDVIKHTFLTPFYCKFQGSPYLCNVFFIVLDLRLTKVGLSGALFLCLYVSSVNFLSLFLLLFIDSGYFFVERSYFPLYIRYLCPSIN